jgi:hypothetical protein
MNDRSDAIMIHERAVVAFASLQIFALIYLQKFALGGSSFPIPVPFLIMLASVGWMVVSRNLSFAAPRLVSYMIFVTCCLWSQSLSGGSLPSLVELILLYGPMTLCASVSERTYHHILDKFTMFMIFPAYVIIVQYAYQKLTGFSDPISMDRMIPKSVLLQGFFYEAHYPWNSTFSRPNGFFFLEPSFASAFTASAAIIEITYFRRPYRLVLMLVATVLSMGATGISMLLIAAPFLLARETPRVGVTVTVAAVIALIAVYILNVPLPLISRVDELHKDDSSGGGRLMLPAFQFVTLLFDPSYLLTGDGAGSVTPSNGGVGVTLMVAWPIVKLLNEYGLLTMTSFVIFYMSGMAGNFNLPLKVTLSIVYFFTGGYLLSPTLVGLLAILCFIVAPMKGQQLHARHLLRQRPV